MIRSPIARVRCRFLSVLPILQVQLRKWIRNVAVLERASPMAKYISSCVRRPPAAGGFKTGALNYSTSATEAAAPMDECAAAPKRLCVRPPVVTVMNSEERHSAAQVFPPPCPPQQPASTAPRAAACPDPASTATRTPTGCRPLSQELLLLRNSGTSCADVTNQPVAFVTHVACPAMLST